MAARQFKTLFCERFGCPEADFPDRALQKCLRWQGRLLFGLVRRHHPNHVEVDLRFIRNLGATTGLREVQREILDYRDAIRARPAFLRSGIGARVSGRKAMKLAKQLFRIK